MRVTCPECKAVFKARGTDDEIDDEPERPRSRRRDDDDRDDRRPGSRNSDRRSRPRRGDDDDDRPRRRRPARDDDAVDDRPRSRRRRDDDYEDDRPRDRNRRKKRINPLLIILPVSGGALLVIAVICYFAFFRGSSLLGGGNVPQSDMVAWAPADATGMVYLDYAALSKHPAVDKDNMFGLGKVPRYGLDPAEVQGVFHAGDTFGGVMVIRTTGALDQATMDRVVRANSGTQANANGKTYYRLPNGGALYKGGDRLLVVASREGTLTQRLGSDEGKVVVSSTMRDFLSRASGDIWSITTAGKGSYTINGEPVEGTVASVTLSGDFVERTSETTFLNGSAADRVAPQLRNQPDTQVSASGRTLKVTTRHRSDFQKIMLMEFTMGHW